MLREAASNLGTEVQLVDALEPLVGGCEGLTEICDKGVIPAPAIFLIVGCCIEIEIPSNGVFTTGSPVGERSLREIETRDATNLPRRSFGRS